MTYRVKKQGNGIPICNILLPQNKRMEFLNAGFYFTKTDMFVNM